MPDDSVSSGFAESSSSLGGRGGYVWMRAHAFAYVYILLHIPLIVKYWMHMRACMHMHQTTSIRKNLILTDRVSTNIVLPALGLCCVSTSTSGFPISASSSSFAGSSFCARAGSLVASGDAAALLAGAAYE